MKKRSEPEWRSIDVAFSGTYELGEALVDFLIFPLRLVDAQFAVDPQNHAMAFEVELAAVAGLDADGPDVAVLMEPVEITDHPGGARAALEDDPRANRGLTVGRIAQHGAFD